MTSVVDLETARAASGVRLVVVANIPSPWSEAAKGIFRLKNVPFVAVRLEAGDKTVRQWTRSRNAPAAMYDDEPARTGWAEILELAERAAPASSPSLIPTSPADRVRMFGLAHEVMGEGGLLWSGRLLSIHAGLTTNGERGFPPPVATYLGKRYGYTNDQARLDAASRQIAETWSLLTEALGARSYYFGDRVTALDIYSAAAVNIFSLLDEKSCPMWPMIRAGFESMREALPAAPDTIVAHRDRMYERHLELPLTF
jgi:glutathione S-transferase